MLTSTNYSKNKSRKIFTSLVNETAEAFSRMIDRQLDRISP